MNSTATYMGTVYPWQCDHVGHMNIMWYVGKFDEATWNFLARIGLTPSYLRESCRGMVAVQQNVAYKRELWSRMHSALGHSDILADTNCRLFRGPLTHTPNAAQSWHRPVLRRSGLQRSSSRRTLTLHRGDCPRRLLEGRSPPRRASSRVPAWSVLTGVQFRRILHESVGLVEGRPVRLGARGTTRPEQPELSRAVGRPLLQFRFQPANAVFVALESDEQPRERQHGRDPQRRRPGERVCRHTESL